MAENQSPSVLGQVVSEAVQGGPVESALQIADSAPVPVDQAQTGISAAEIINENQRYSSVTSEGVASVGNPPAIPHDRMDEFVPVPIPVARSLVTAAGFEGETSGGADVVGGSIGYAMVAPISPMDFQAAASAPDVIEAAPSHIGTGKRKNTGGDSHLESKRAEGLHRAVSDPASDLAMVTGDSEEYVAAPAAPDACDSNAEGSIDEPPALVGVGDNNNLAGIGQNNGLADRPTDADIIAWENKIREEEVLKLPLIGDIEPLDALEAEYASGSDVFLSKITSLRTTYGSIRRARGDGNCFFRSFAFAYLEHLLLHGDEAERDRAVARLLELQKQLTDAGYDELVIESPMDILLRMLRSINAPVDPLTLQIIEINMRDDATSNYIVFLLRMITAAEVKRRDDFFAPFIIGLSGLDVDTFCSKCIDPMGEESDHVQLVALTDALQVPLRVAYLDRSSGESPDSGGVGTSNGGVAHVDMHDFIPSEAVQTEPRVHLLYRPGHYDVLYPHA